MEMMIARMAMLLLLMMVMMMVMMIVMMMVMMIFIDQGDVLRRITDAGIGVGVDKAASGEELYQAIREVRDNPVYKQNIDKLSRVYRDRRFSVHLTSFLLFRIFNVSGLILKMWRLISSSLSGRLKELSI